MNYAGQIIDKSDGNPLAGVSVTVYGPNGSYTGTGTATNAQGFFKLSGDTIIPGNEIRFTHATHLPIAFLIDEMDFTNMLVELEPNVKEETGVTVTATKKNNYAWLALLAIPVIANSQKKKSVGAVDTNTWLLLGGGLIAFKLVNDILVKFGLGKGPGKGAADAETVNPNSPWKPAYWQSVPAGQSYKLITEAEVQSYITRIHNAFQVIQDDYNKILSVFSSLKTKTQVSYLADKFQQKYSEDLLSFLQDGGGILPWDGLSDAHLKELTDLVNNLPPYMP